MVTPRIKVQFTGLANLKRENTPKIFKNNLEKLGEEWHSKNLPKRFAPGAANVYHLKPRSKKYIKWIKKDVGAWHELYKDGKMMSSVMAHYNVITRNRGGLNQTTIKVKLGHPVQPYVAFEVTKLLKMEFEKLKDKYVYNVVDEMKKPNPGTS